MTDHTKNRGKHPALDQLSTSELEELLWRDFTASGDEGPDLNTVLAVMEVIDSREEGDIPAPDADAAWAAFRANVIETEKEERPGETPAEPVSAPVDISRKKPPRLRWVISAAAVVCVLACILVIPASGKGLWESLVDWTAETFSFKDSAVPASGLEEGMFAQLEESVAALTDLPVLPTWYPEGTILIDLSVEDTSFDTTLFAWFEWNQQEFSFVLQIPKQEDPTSTEYEKDDGPVETYYAADIPHYIMRNMGNYTAVWRNGDVECSIQGKLTTEELKTMIDSIYP